MGDFPQMTFEVGGKDLQTKASQEKKSPRRKYREADQRQRDTRADVGAAWSEGGLDRAPVLFPPAPSFNAEEHQEIYSVVQKFWIRVSLVPAWTDGRGAGRRRRRRSRTRKR